MLRRAFRKTLSRQLGEQHGHPLGRHVERLVQHLIGLHGQKPEQIAHAVFGEIRASAKQLEERFLGNGQNATVLQALRRRHRQIGVAQNMESEEHAGAVAVDDFLAPSGIDAVQLHRAAFNIVMVAIRLAAPEHHGTGRNAPRGISGARLVKHAL